MKDKSFVIYLAEDIYCHTEVSQVILGKRMRQLLLSDSLHLDGKHENSTAISKTYHFYLNTLHRLVMQHASNFKGMYGK